MPTTTLIPSEPTPVESPADQDLDVKALRALDWLARTARWQRRLDQLRGDTV